MRKAMKPTVVAGILGGVALMALGATSAQAEDGEECKKEGGVLRCYYTTEYTFNTESGDTVRVISNQSLRCSGANPAVKGTTTQEADGDRDTNVAMGSVCTQNGRTYNS